MVLEHFLASNGCNVADLAKTDEGSYYFSLECGNPRHWTHKTLKAVTRAPNVALRWKVCAAIAWNYEAGVPCPSSNYELQVCNILEALSVDCIVEVKLVKNAEGGVWSGPQDIYLFDASMVIQIDGEGHNKWAYHTIDVRLQQDRDSEFNRLCWRQGVRLLRIDALLRRRIV